MSGRGPSPTPTSIRVLRGRPGKRARNDAEPAPPGGKAKPPAWLKGRTRKLWQEIAPVLEPMGVLTTADPHALGLLCDAYAEYLDARDVIREKGATYESTQLVTKGEDMFEKIMVRPRPEVAMAQDAWKRVKGMMQEFGLTPSARSRIAAAPKGGESKPFEQWRKHGGSCSG